MIHFISSSFISRIDSKGRISIPIRLRAKLKLVEGSKVRIIENKNRLIIIPESDYNLPLFNNTKRDKRPLKSNFNSKFKRGEKDE